MDSRIAIDKLGHAGLNGSSSAAADPKNPAALPAACAVDDWKKMRSYVASLRSPRRPVGLDAAKVATGRSLFEQANCQGCHGGAKWTISRVFYNPDPTGGVNNALKALPWAPRLNDFPAALLPATTPNMQTMRYSGTNAAALDQLTCILRPVGTFGVAESGVGVAELRQNMIAPAQGNEADGKGYNPPSLLNMVSGAPYLHAGNARTLEALLSDTFTAHYAALAPGFAMDATKRDALVQFLLAIDEDQQVMTVPAVGSRGGNFCAAQ
jgi:CxxC motif-containing protein (DUF1111 family)